MSSSAVTSPTTQRNSGNVFVSEPREDRPRAMVCLVAVDTVKYIPILPHCSTPLLQLSPPLTHCHALLQGIPPALPFTFILSLTLLHYIHTTLSHCTPPSHNIVTPHTLHPTTLTLRHTLSHYTLLMQASIHPFFNSTKHSMFPPLSMLPHPTSNSLNHPSIPNYSY